MKISCKILLLISTALFFSADIYAQDSNVDEFYFKKEIETIINNDKEISSKKEFLEKYIDDIKNAPMDFQIYYYKYLHNIYYEEYNTEKSLALVDELIDLFKIKGDKKNLAEYYVKKAEDLVNSEAGKAEYILNEALIIAEELKDNDLIIFVNSNLASAKSSMGFYFKSLEILNNAELHLTEDVKPKNKIELFSEMGFVYESIKNNKKAKEYYLKIIDIYEKEKLSMDYDYIGTMYDLTDMAETPIEKNKINEQIAIFKKQTKEKHLLIFADQINAKNNPEKKESLKIINKVIKYFKEDENDIEVLNSKRIKLEILLNLKKYQEIINLVESLKENKNKNEGIVKKINIEKYKYLAISYENLGDFKKSYEYYSQYQKDYEENFNKSFVKTIRNLKKIFKTVEKETENAELLKETESKKNKLDVEKENIKVKEKIVYGSYIILSIAVLIAFVSIFGYRRIKKIATIDDLTQVFNRKTITSIAKKYYNTKNENVNIILMDIDFFKKINDNYGHNIGDEVLKEVSRVSKEALGEKQYFGRYGGEEFLIVSRDNIENTNKLAEKMRRSIQDIRLHDYPEMRLTSSFGVSEKQIDEKSLEELIKRSDQNLYKAKDEGRNRVVF
jgi:diguanylate cyclase (GGDEF)-like protein